MSQSAIRVWQWDNIHNTRTLSKLLNGIHHAINNFFYYLHPLHFYCGKWLLWKWFVDQKRAILHCCHLVAVNDTEINVTQFLISAMSYYCTFWHMCSWYSGSGQCTWAQTMTVKPPKCIIDPTTLKIHLGFPSGGSVTRGTHIYTTYTVCRQH